MIKIVKLKKTHGSAPSTWEGRTQEHRKVEAHYEWGCLYVSIGGKQIFSEVLDQSGAQGSLSTKELIEATKGKIRFDLKR